MAFDPITGVWAANKAVQKVGSSDGGSGGNDTKTIDLLNYTFTNNKGESATLNQALLTVFSMSLTDGKAYSFTAYPDSKFFEDCYTDEPLRFKLTYQESNGSITQIYLEGSTKLYYQGSLMNINIGYNIYFNGSLVDVKCWIMPNGISIDAKVVLAENL